MYIAQAKCPSNLNALSFLLSKITSHSRQIKRVKYSKFEHLPSLYIVFNINIDGGGRGIRTPCEPLSPCWFSRPIPSAGL